MKTYTVTVDVDRSAGLTESNFSMDATADAFEILSSGLYSNKPKAVIRELACNAHDSHVAAGTPDLPIEIKLPSYLDLNFYVKDFGTGLTDYEVRGGWYNEETDDKVSDLDMTMSAEEYLAAGYVRSTGVYNTYFRSTKTKSNDFIGQLGLGSKSPFSYASTFNVEVRKDGEVRIYTCYKNEDLKPVITLMSCNPTEEPNGITVSMAVRREDIDKFSNAARSALMYFKPTPNFVAFPFQPYHIKHTIKSDTWRVRQADSNAQMTGPYVVQGFVAYPVDKLLLVEGGLSGTALKLAEQNIDLYVPIGSVLSAPSREALQYDRRTVVNLIGTFKNAAEEVTKSFQMEFDKCKNAYEGAALHDKFMHSGDTFKQMYLALHASDAFKVNGLPVKPALNMSLSSMMDVTIHFYEQGKGTNLKSVGAWVPSPDTKLVEVKIRANMHFVFVNKPTNYTTRLRAYLASLPITDGRKPTLFIVKAANKFRVAEAQKECGAIAKQLGVTFKSFDDLPAVEAKKSSGSRAVRAPKLKNTRKRWQAFRTTGRSRVVDRTFKSSCWLTENIDLSKGGYYILIKGSIPIPSEANMQKIHMFDKYLATARTLGILEVDTKAPIYGMTEGELKDAVAAGGKWIDLFDHISERFQEIVKTDTVAKKMAWNTIQQKVTAEQRHIIDKTTGKDDALYSFGPGVMKSLINDTKAFEVGVTDALVNTTDLLDFCRMEKHESAATVVEKANTAAERIVTRWANLEKDYPMISFAPFTYWSSYTSIKKIVKFVEYINLIDRDRVAENHKNSNIDK